MTRTATLLVIGAAGLLAGCKSYDRPRDNRLKPRPEVPLVGGDRPSIEEQKFRGRDKYALSQDAEVSPYTPFDRPSPTGR